MKFTCQAALILFAQQVASEREAFYEAKRRRSLDVIQSGTAIQRISEANLRDEHISSIRRKEKEEREKWRKKRPEKEKRRGSTGGVEEEDNEVDGIDEETGETAEPTAAQRKAEKEHRKAENKDKNKTWKKFKLKRRSSDKHQRSQSEPAVPSGEADDGISADNVSENISIHEGGEPLPLRRVMSEGTVGIFSSLSFSSHPSSMFSFRLLLFGLSSFLTRKLSLTLSCGDHDHQIYSHSLLRM